MTRGKIVLVPFPFDDLSASRVRPAVCLTEPIGPHRHVVLAFITQSRLLTNHSDSDVLLSEQTPAFPATGLRLSSTIRLHRLLTIFTSLIQRGIGPIAQFSAK